MCTKTYLRDIKQTPNRHKWKKKVRELWKIVIKITQGYKKKSLQSEKKNDEIKTLTQVQNIYETEY